MNLSFALPVILLACLLTLLVTSSFIILPNLLSLSLPECGHVVLVSSPRHGSTWFLDSAEGCPSRQSARGDYADLIKNTEIWATHKGSLQIATSQEAAEYVLRNSSVKIFPGVVRRQGIDFMTGFFQEAKDRNIPFFVLNRRCEDAYASIQDAVANDRWAANSMNSNNERVVEVTEKLKRYRSNTAKYFETVEGIMRNVGLEWDRLDYEDARGMREIVGERNRCLIKNCNFL